MSLETASRRVQTQELYRGRFLKFSRLTYRSLASKEQRTWESVDRTTTFIPTAGAAIDAVEIVAILNRRGDTPSQFLVLVTQYRPPVDAICVELPAGLVDSEETVAEAALRELKEETGFVGTMTGISPQLAYEPGMTSSKCCMVFVEIDGADQRNINPKQELQDDEEINVVLVPTSCITETLGDYARKGYLIDAKLYGIAVGLSIDGVKVQPPTS